MVFRRGRGHKKYGRKSVKRYRRRYSRKNAGTKGVRLVKLKYISETDFTYDKGTGVGTGRIALTDLTAVINGAGTVADWSNAAGMFDLYRVHAVKVQYLPGPTFNQIATTSATTTNYSPIAWACDYNTQSNFLSTGYSAAMEYENVKLYNLYRPCKYYVRVPKNVRGDYQGGYMPTSSPLDLGSIGYYFFTDGTGGIGTEVIGLISVTYYVSLKMRK